ncbi:MAG: hypothetical protein WB661_02485 [Candidatus Bathyarchaeia archaeon]
MNISAKTKILAGLLLLISTLAVTAWPLTAPTGHAANPTVSLPKAKAGIGYQLTLGQPVCARLRNLPTDDTGDRLCKRIQFF